MSAHKIHFMYEAGKEPGDSFGTMLSREIGQTDIDGADMIVSIGGDGILLSAFLQSAGRKVYGLTPPGSNSRGFWTDHDVETSKDLLERIDSAHKFLIAPLKGTIYFAKGRQQEIFAFNDIMIERPTAQSVLFNLHAKFGEDVVPPQRVMAGGYIFSTAYGSTGGNRRYGGGVMPIHNDVIMLTGKGISDPEGTHPVVVGLKGTSFYADFVSVNEKRPVRIDYDGRSISGSEADGAITGLAVCGAEDKTVEFLTPYNPDVRSYSSTFPRQAV